MMLRERPDETQKVPWLRMIDEFILNEYKARQLWDQRDYAGAMVCAGSAVEVAEERNDSAAWWRMKFLYGECQIELGQLDDCAETARILNDHASTQEDAELAAKAKALLSAVLRNSGQLHEALALAREAALDLPEKHQTSSEKLDAQQVLVAVLAESGNLEDAWREAEILASLVGGSTAPDKAGKAYWSVGNVAFLMGMNAEATYYHGRAASCLSPSNDVNLWAQFNKASAFMRLSANLVEPETLQCIERAELALSITGGTEHDELDVVMIRAYWNYLTGELEPAREKMASVLRKVHVLSPLSQGDAHLLFARILETDGDFQEAAAHAEKSAALFDFAGAQARAAQARFFMDAVVEANPDNQKKPAGLQGETRRG